MTDIEIKQILGEIADDCYYKPRCRECKFFKNRKCVFKGIPADWDIECIDKEDDET